MLISLHLPKTAGSSFLVALEASYNSRILRDYADLPINTSIVRRRVKAMKWLVLNGVNPPKNIDCIHGHFLPMKYLFCGNTKFITWIRDPVERLGSHYYYWVRNYNPSTAPALHKKVVEEEWSLERFCLSSEMKNFYSQFLWGFPIKRFDFIGVTEYYESDLDYLSNNIVGTQLLVHKENINKGKAGFTYFKDKGLRKRIEQHHSKDISLYNLAVNLRKSR